MNEWAARLLAVLPERLNSLNSSISGKPTSDTFDQFMQQVSDEQADRMYIQRELDETVECRPTFEQVALEPIADEMGRNASILKTLEGVLYERQTGLSLLNTSLTKARSVLETIEYRECSLKTAVDAYFAVADQECQQSKQQIFLGDLKRSLNEIRHDAQRKIADYTKELQYIERDVNAAEKKLTKSKDQFERCIDHKNRIEALEMEGLLNTNRSTISSSDAASPVPSWVNPSPANTSVGGRHSINSLLSSARKGTEATKDFREKLRELDENAAKLEKEIKDDIRTLLHAIEQRDKTLLAIRKAYQKLDLDCKSAVHITLRKLVEKDLENARLYLSAIENLQTAVQAIDIDSDVQQFIAKFSSEDSALIMTSQALSLLNDLTPVEETHIPVLSSVVSSVTTAPNPMPSSTTVPVGGKATQSPETIGSGSSSPALPEPAPPAKRSTYNISAVWDGDGIANKALKAEFVSHLSQIFYSATSPTFKHFPPVLEAAEVKPDHELSSGKTDPVIISSTATIKPIVPVDVSLPVSKHYSMGRKPQQGSNPFDESPLITAKNPFDDMDSICVSRNSSGSQNPFDECDDSSYLSDNASTSRYKQSVSNTGSSSSSSSAKKSSAVRGKSSSIHALSKSSNTIQYSHYKHHASPLVFDDPPEERHLTPNPEGTSPVENSQDAKKLKAQRDIETNSEQYISDSEWFRSHTDAKCIESVRWINNAVRTKSGRDLFTHELNQFRSKQVDVGEGFDALGAVLWNALSYCQSEKDIHNASVIMMLSQTFFRPKKNESSTEENSGVTSPANDEVDKDEDEVAQRGAQHREYIKEKLLLHVIWQDGNYWEQALWKCTIEQLQTIPYEKDWHDMDRTTRFHAVRRVHDVIFSQVMAIIHSMMELGCPQKQTREFLYRMCVIHQLSESQRLQLLEHTLREKSYT